MKQYSLSVGVRKSLIQVALFGVSALVMFLAYSHQALLTTPLWVLAEQYIKPVLGTLSLGGLLTLAVNWLKNKDNG